MSTSTNIYWAQSIKYQRIKFSNFYTHRFTVTTKDGSVHEFDSFSAGPLELQMLPDDMAHELKQAANEAEAVPA
jgi:hypothetical protein